MLNILIADDHPIFRAGIKNYINREPDLKVIYEAEDGTEVFNYLIENDVDLVVIDIGLPGRSGLDMLPDIKKIKPKMPVLILSMHPEERFGLRAIKAGASCYLSKESDPKILIEAIRTISTGRKYITPIIAEKMAGEFEKDIKQNPHEILSNREFEIMRLISIGKTIKEIADMLSISINTVNTYRARIMEKMEMHSNMELAHYAIENKLID